MPEPRSKLSAALETFLLIDAVVIALGMIAFTFPVLGFRTAIILAVALPLGLLAGLTRLALSVFAESRIRLLEMMLASLVFGALTLSVLKWLHIETWLISRPRQLILQLMTIAIMLIVCASGSAWAWGLAARYNISDARHRVLILCYGWLLGVGVLSIMTFSILALVSIWSKTGLHSDLRDLYIASSLGAPLALPGMFCALMLRRRALAAARGQK